MSDFIYNKTSHARSRLSLKNLESSVENALKATGFALIRYDDWQADDEDEDDFSYLSASKTVTLPALPVRHDWTVSFDDKDGPGTHLYLSMRFEATRDTWLWLAGIFGLCLLPMLAEIVLPGAAVACNLVLIWTLVTVIAHHMHRSRLEKQFWNHLSQTTPLQRGGDEWTME